MIFGDEIPRVWTKPLRPLTPETSRGFEVIDFAENVLGLKLIAWQSWLLVHMLELLPTGMYRFRTIIVLVARQNGKSTLLQVLALWRMYVDGANLVIGTAQNLDTAEETWQGAVDLAQSIPELRAEIADVVRTNGKKALVLTGGERYKVAAASRRGGRGLTGDFVALDELREHKTWDAWAAITKTTMARATAQIAGFSNAGDRASVVLAYLRVQAASTLGEAGGFWDGNGEESLGIFEWSAPEDVVCTCQSRPHGPECMLQDRRYWAMANPSMNVTITERAIQSALATDPDEIVLTEVFCRWVDGVGEPVFPPVDWANAADEQSVVQDPVSFGIEVSYPDRDWASISIAGARADGLVHGELIDRRPGTEWVVPRLIELRNKWWPVAVVIDPGSPAGSLIPELEAAEIEVEKPSMREVAQGCGLFYDMVTDSHTFRHRNDPRVNEALSGAGKRSLGDAWTFARQDSETHIDPIMSMALAVWGWAKFAYLSGAPSAALI